MLGGGGMLRRLAAGPYIIIYEPYMIQPLAFVAPPPPEHASRYLPKLHVFANPTSSGRPLAVGRDAWQRCTQCAWRLHAALTSLVWSLRAVCLQPACSSRAACTQPACSLHTAHTQLACNRHGKHTDPTHVASIMQHSRYKEFL